MRFKVSPRNPSRARKQADNSPLPPNFVPAGPPIAIARQRYGQRIAGSVAGVAARFARRRQYGDWRSRNRIHGNADSWHRVRFKVSRKCTGEFTIRMGGVEELDGANFRCRTAYGRQSTASTASSCPSQARTGSGGYFRNRASVAARPHMRNTDPRPETTCRTCRHVPHNPAELRTRSPSAISLIDRTSQINSHEQPKSCDGWDTIRTLLITCIHRYPHNKTALSASY